MKLVETYPSEVPFDREETRARNVAEPIIEAGGQAVVREYLDLGMMESKDLVDSAPCVLTKSMEGGRAKSFHAALTQAGATARMA